MPAPPNTTPATATLITTLPYSQTIDVSDAPTGTGYDPSCGSYQTQSVWYKYVPPATGVISAVGVTFATNVVTYPDYIPRLSVWTGGTLAQVTGQCFVMPISGTGLVSVSVTPGQTYYFQVTNESATQESGVLTFGLTSHTPVAIPAGSFLISNDTPGFPGAIINTAGTLLQVFGFPAFECASWLPDGTLAVAAERTDGKVTKISIYNGSLQFQSDITSFVTNGAEAVSPLTNDGTDTFYYCDNVSNTSSIVTKFQADGTVLQTRDISSTNRQIEAIAVSADENTLYTSRNVIAGGYSQARSIGRWDLAGNTTLSDLYTPVAGTYSASGRDLLRLGDGSFLWPVKLTGGAHTWRILRISGAGALTDTYVLTPTDPVNGTNGIPRIALSPTDATVFYAMDWPETTGTGSPARIQKIRLSDGTVLATTTTTIKEPDGTGTSPQFGVSQSCPLLITMAIEETPTNPDGEIITIVPTDVEIETAQPVVGFSTTTLIRRRLRRSPIVWAEDSGLQTNVRVNLFAVDMQPGVGTSDFPDPQVMVRASRDGGRTWLDWRQMTAGAVGTYMTRLNAWRWGSGRQWVFEVAVTDGVQWNLVNAYLDAEPGRS